VRATASVRPADHQWTLEEIRALTPREYEANKSTIRAQLQRLGQERNAGQSNPQSIS
jgi:hypothetical protein